MARMFHWVAAAAILLANAHAGNVLLYPFGHCLNSHLLNFEKMAATLEEGGHEVEMLINSNYMDYAHQKHSGGQHGGGQHGGGQHSGGQHGGGQHGGQEKIAIKKQVFAAPDDFIPICDRHSIPFMLTTPTAQRFNQLMETFYRYCDAILSDKLLMLKLKQKNYDLFIFDSLDPCGRVLADYLDVPIIPLMTTGLGHWDGNPRPPSYVPSALSTFTPSMTFFQRTLNLMLKVMYDILPFVVGFDVPFEELKKKYDLNTTLSISKTFNRATLKFVNSDFALEYPSPIEPDTIMVGGYSIDPPTELQGALKDILEGAGPSGIIVFSFGTLIGEYSPDYTRIFLDAFSRLPQTVIWRNGNSLVLPHEVPRNVIMMPWIPQNALLAHPSTRLFITHCGLNGAMEAAHFGVPVVAIPIADDQFNHANKLVNHLEMGVQLDLKSLTVDTLEKAVQTVLNDSTYAENARRVSSLFNDQPLGKREIIRYWVDWVLRHKGAPYLRSVAHQLTWFQYQSLDSLAFLVCLSITVLWCLVNLLRRLITSATKILCSHVNHILDQLFAVDEDNNKLKKCE